jgi:hypothetical protein
VQQLERQLLGHRSRRHGRGNLEHELLPAPQAQRRLRGPPAHLDVARLNEPLNPGTGEISKGTREVLIQPLASGLGRGLVLAHLGGYQIFDFTCAFERRTMSLTARSKKFVRVKTSVLTRLL